jgi:hypothetical protein
VAKAREHAVADQVGGRLVPRRQEQRAGRDQLLLAEPALLVGIDQLAEQVVDANLAPLRDDRTSHSSAQFRSEGRGTR